MTVQDFAGRGVFVPEPPGITVNPALATTLAIAGANASDKLAQMGRVAFAARTGSKNITKIHFLFGAITKSNGSTLKVSLQDVDLSNGPAIRPDGVVDQSYTILNADAGFVSNGWYTATLDAPRTVTYGDLLAVVWEWASAVSGDNVVITGYSLSSAASNAAVSSHQNCCAQFTASAWGIISMATNVLLEFDDGTFGTLDGSLLVSAVGSTGFNSGSTPDEYCMEFQLPFNCEVDGIWTMLNFAAGANCDIVLYDGTTALATVSVDANALQANAARFVRVNFPKVSLTANTTYRIAIKPTTTNTITLYYRDINNAAHRAVMALGTTAQINSRTDAGAWGTATATRQFLAGIRISGIDVDPPDIASSGGSYAFVA